ncbi:MAG: hypothetical protein JW900_12010 [Anaerolineae bacterium]|nr:hypothetical protein [Anaerolineae bacterium]
MAEYGESLSEREIEIVRLVSTGASNKEIAHQLHISANTVKVHLRNVYSKLGAASRTEATMIAVREGWVVVPDMELVDGEPRPAPRPDEPPLSWFRRGVLVAAAALAVAGLLLSWPRSAPAVTPAPPLPPENGAGPPPIVDTGQDARWAELAQMPTRRVWLAVAAWDWQLYAIGGQSPDGVTGVVEVYDPAADTWSRAAGKPTPVAHVAAAVLGDRIVVPGGCLGDGTALDVVEVYYPLTDTWQTAAPLPQPACAYALSVFEGRLYLFGGTDGEGYLATTFVYDPDEDQWEERAPMGDPRALLAAAHLAEKIYVVGGYRDGRELTTCQAYEPAADSWTDCTPLIMGRSGLGLVALGGRLYAIGGGGLGGYHGFNERYDPYRERWEALYTPVIGEWRGAGVALMGLVVYTVGGYSDDYLSLTLSFEPLPVRIFIPVAGEP